MSDLTLMGESPFDAIRRVDDGFEYWSARDLMPLLGYGADWRNFADAVERARTSARNAGMQVAALFVEVTEKSGGRPRVDFHLTRYACYLVAMNGDPRKSEIAAAQTYFALRTREAETRPSVAQITRRELASMVIAEADRADAAEAKAAELAPAAHSWSTLAEATGDYSLREAAQILDRDPEISTGQNRLARYLREIQWTDRDGEPYQRQGDAGRLVRRPRSYGHPTTGAAIATSQVRVTPKGIHELHRRLGGSEPVLLGVAS